VTLCAATRAAARKKTHANFREIDMPHDDWRYRQYRQTRNDHRPRQTGNWSGRQGYQDDRWEGFPGQHDDADHYGVSENDRGYWPAASNPYAQPHSYGGRRNYAPGYGRREFSGGYRQGELRGFGGFDTGGWGDDPRSNFYREHYAPTGPEERGFWDRATDEVSSWFGDDDAQRRREIDEAQDHRGRGPKGYKRSDDRIREDLSDRLSDDRWLDASDIDVQVKDREVTLTGTVGSRAAKHRAEMIADNCSGVVDVQNNLRVTRHTESPSSFGDTAAAPAASGKTKTRAF
jgi:osmotically-inducible protein OsmY